MMMMRHQREEDTVVSRGCFGGVDVFVKTTTTTLLSSSSDSSSSSSFEEGSDDDDKADTVTWGKDTQICCDVFSSSFFS